MKAKRKNTAKAASYFLFLHTGNWAFLSEINGGIRFETSGDNFVFIVLTIIANGRPVDVQ